MLATSSVQQIFVQWAQMRLKPGSNTAGVQDKYAVYEHYCDVDMSAMT